MEELGRKICLDTNVLINLLRNKQEDAAFIRQADEQEEFATTYINLFELYHGAYKSAEQQQNLKAIARLLERIDLLNLSEESVKKAAELKANLEKEGRTIDVRDLFIGAIALTSGYTLMTKNKKHFLNIPSLKLLE